MSTTPLLSVSDLTVSYGRTEVVHSIGFTLHAGQSLGIIGESGSGKSTTARAILRLLDTSATVGGEIRLHGDDVQLLDDRRFRSLRGVRLGLVPQDPGTALNPVRTIGSQAHEAAALAPREPGESPSERAREKARILAVLDRVGLPDPQAVYDSYPHQLSGGMLQRVLIGLAVLPEPDLLIADEPTSALDVTVQRRILDLLDELRASLNIGLILITHDLAIAAERTDSLVVLRDGRIVEQGPTQQVLHSPTSAYTVNLRNAVPSLNPDRYVERRRHRSQVTNEHPTVGQATELAPVITAENLSRTFTSAGRAVSALADLSFKVPRGTTHALVGESGSGKTTAVRILVGLETPDSGQVTVGGHAVTGPGQRRQTDLYRRLQIVYQNPFTSLDPTWSVARIIREPLDRFRVGSRSRRRERAEEALHSVGLDTAVLGRRAGTLSGGQRQRVAIARALALEPEVLVLDEPTSALDVSVQAEIFDLLIELQAEKGLTYLVVSHDLPLIRQVADTVTVMRRGRAMESGAVADVFTTPSHEYTRALLAATPDHAGIRADAVPVA